jgi:hypothetical protein
MPQLDGPPHDLPRLIEVLDRYEVEYLIVGGAAAYAYGAERPTDDADCVVRRERTNLDRLAGALRELHARLRVGGMTDAEARALPVQIDGTTLDMAGMSTWMTDAGPFDVLAGLEAPTATWSRTKSWRPERRCCTAMASRSGLPLWRTSFGPRSAPTGPRIGRPFPSCARYGTPQQAKIRRRHRTPSR